MSSDPRQTFILPRANRGDRERAVGRVARFLAALGDGDAWKVEVTKSRKRRSLQANAYLWGVCYPTFIAGGGEALRGWTADDLHEYFLGEVFGWERLEGLGRTRLRPLKRSSRMNTTEFAEFVDAIQRRAAELGIYIPSPNEGAAHE